MKDRNFRIEVAADGIHVFNARGHWTAADAFSLIAFLRGDELGDTVRALIETFALY